MPIIEDTGPATPTTIITDSSIARKERDAHLAAAKRKFRINQAQVSWKGNHPPKETAKKPTKKKKPSALDKYLAGDTTYQQQLAEFNAEKDAYKTKYTRQNQITERDYNTAKRTADLAAARDREDQKYQYAGNGILHSGVYAKALGDYNTDFNTKMNNLLQGKTDTLATAKGDYNDFLRSLGLQKNAAKQDAIRRREAKLVL